MDRDTEQVGRGSRVNGLPGSRHTRGLTVILIAVALVSLVQVVRFLGWIGWPGPSLLESGVAGTALLGCLLTLAVPARNRANLALLVISLSISGLIGAALYSAYREYLIAGTRLAPAPELGNADLDARLAHEIAVADWRPREAVAAELKARGEKLGVVGGLFPLLPWADSGYTEGLLPLGGTALGTTIYCNESGYWAVYRSDRYGFNNPDTTWDETGTRIMLVGDSYAQGACVRQEETVAADLRAHGYPTVSIGIGGNGPLLELAGLTEYGPRFKPDIVVWFYFDWHMLNRLRLDRPDSGWGGEAYSAYLTQYLDDGFRQGLVDRQGEIDTFWRSLSSHRGVYDSRRSGDSDFDKKRIYRLNAVRERLGLRPLSGPGEELSEEETIELFLRILSTAKRRVEGWGGRLYLASFYDISRFRGGPETNRAEVLPRVEALGIPVIDIDAAIAATPDPLANFPFHGKPTPFNSTGWGHFNAEGYKVFADAVTKAIR